MNYKMQLDSQLCFQISRAHQLFTKFYKKPLGKFHLTYVQYTTLMALWEEDHITVNQLSEKLGLNNGTLTPLLKRLEKSGWVQRQRDPKDERRVIITLTKYGREQKDKVFNETASCLDDLNFSSEQYYGIMHEVQEVQRRLQNNLDKERKKEKSNKNINV